MSKSEDCLFCKIIDGRIPSEKVYEDDTTYAFKDINPKAKVHVLIVPKDHYANVAELAAVDPAELAISSGSLRHRRQGVLGRVPSGVQHRPRRRADRVPRARACAHRREARRVGRFVTTTTRTITIPSQLDPVAVFGPVDEVIRQVEHAFPDLTIIVRGDRVAIVSHSKSTESQASRAEDVIHTIIQAAYSAPMDADTVRRLLDQDVLPNKVRAEHPGYGRSAERGRASLGGSASGDARKPRIPGVITFAAGQPVRAKTAGQDRLRQRRGRPHHHLRDRPGRHGQDLPRRGQGGARIPGQAYSPHHLTRPAVEAGESLGFLPGTLNDKVDPYLRPLYDALSDMLGPDQLHRYLDDGTIEVAPLAYMRGRTLNDAYVILDEAQNTTEQQMKMFLTRLGFNTTMIITGDVTQVDLAVPRSGLATIEAFWAHRRHSIRPSRCRGRGPP